MLHSLAKRHVFEPTDVLYRVASLGMALPAKPPDGCAVQTVFPTTLWTCTAPLVGSAFAQRRVCTYQRHKVDALGSVYDSSLQCLHDISLYLERWNAVERCFSSFSMKKNSIEKGRIQRSTAFQRSTFAHSTRKP